MARRMQAAYAGAAAALLLTACGSADEGASGPDDPEVLERGPDDGDGDDDGGDGDDATASPDDGGDMDDDDPAALAVADAAERTGVAEGEITVVTNESVTWRDGSLGCPQPGQFYTQALVDGYRIVVEADGERLHYHGQAGGPPAYCADPSDPAQGGSDAGVVDH